MSLFIVCCLGIIAGIFTGLFPGIHINLVAGFIFVNVGYLLNFLEVRFIVLFLLCMGIVHTFMDFIPSVLFGVPSADNALSVLPAHRMVLDGDGFKAIFLSSLGSLAGMFFAGVFLFLFLNYLERFYSFFKIYIVYFLGLSIVFLILGEKGKNQKFWAVIVTLFSAGLGCLVLNSSFVENPLLVLFSGLFGISTLIYSLMFGESRLPVQRFDVNFKFSRGFFKATVIGSIASAICSVTPGIGNSQAATLCSLFFRKITSELFIVTLGVINTINFALSIVVFYTVSRARNGSILVISQIVEEVTLNDLFLYFGIMILVAIISFFLTIFLGKIFLKMIVKVNVKLVNFIILFFVIMLVSFLSNWVGFIVLICSTCLGILCVSLNVKRVHLMNVLIIPIIFNLL